MEDEFYVAGPGRRPTGDEALAMARALADALTADEHRRRVAEAAAWVDAEYGEALRELGDR
ncbi:MAG: hypothetical protein M3Q47_02530 [Actinomycetota bacterium]|nr:hypothetical protein [Actinomycetota bacterium]